MKIIGLVSIELALTSQLLTDTLGARMTFRKEYLKAMKKSLKTLHGFVKERTPVGATGRLMRSIGWAMRDVTPIDPWSFPTGPVEIKGKVFSTKAVPWEWAGIFKAPAYFACTYQRAVEAGTKPHWPPFLELLAWVTHILDLPTRGEERKAAFLIGRKISRVGTEGKWMFRNAQADFESQGIFERNVEEATDRAMRKMSVTTPWWAKMWPT